ncbi:hypothetical protein [Melittangium boletus]|uniref:Haloacid dehalogenase-like hydrolase n=1 Tax=Melittangium boletus DSM 14713 TaxID=1294270 RepID=A0A250I7H7_9BACT|nr:hypothetical protein [Melittangium boletus]ATB27121.1 hypothetical protein MEBOL_000559 [Melittangium boletus DSM 14713]
MASDLKTRVREGWQQALRDILERSRSLGSQAVLAFDLDSTLFDNRPRQARILREFGLSVAHEKLRLCEPHHWDSGFDMRGAMRKCGLSEEEVEAHYEAARTFWLERFFTSDYCVDDATIQGAAAFTCAVVASGAHLVYVTGRHEGMRAGTEDCMRRHGLAQPDGERVHLLMKPNARDDDDAFKREAHARLGEWGTVVAAFDNEPTHANDYLRRFPGARVIHLATDHSGRPVTLLDGIVSVPHFSHDS